MRNPSNTPIEARLGRLDAVLAGPAALVKADHVKWGNIVRETGIKVE